MKVKSLWQNGVLVAMSSQVGIITCSLPTKRVNVKVCTKQAQTEVSGAMLIRSLVETIEMILDCYYRQIAPSCRRFIPCVHCRRVSPTFE
eukprot:CAMPEP_0177676184 /NCGR_PEP_ID=MMETSP0447-20121125/27638_1 /TAXON_ID=0 /ORGANISM="Stygamoeba regulata, Strain BSH-02190019" /LENGTH=89 /DNA_ID=CAMNT_0019184699 /DNA_START=12 /DNA_END=278 /DNA_ORIENTATION=-